MTEPKSLYQFFYKSYLGSWSFQNGDEVLTIKKFKPNQEVTNPQTGKEEIKNLLYFEEYDIPMVCNVTNAAAVAYVAGTDDTDKWPGHKVKVGTAKVKAYGEIKEAIRIREEKVERSATESMATDKQIEDLEELIQAGKINKEAMLEHFHITKLADLTEKEAQKIIDKKKQEPEF